MKICVERTNKQLNLKFQGKVKDLLKKLDLNPEIVLVTKNNVLVTEEDMLKNTDEVKVLSVISGG
ncbi:MAG: MoaD/ThiS family protein [Nanoarchaeota archaeon]